MFQLDILNRTKNNSSPIQKYSEASDNFFYNAHDIPEGTMIVCFKVSSGHEIETHYQKLLFM